MTLTLSEAELLSGDGLKITGATVTISDTAAHLETLTAAQIIALPALGVGGLNSNNADVAFNASQTSAIVTANLSLSVAGDYSVWETFSDGAVIGSANNCGGGGDLTLSTNSNGATVDVGASALSVTAGGETIPLHPYGAELIVATGRTSDVFVYTPGFGHDTITGFAATGVSHDVLQFNASAFGAGLTAANQSADLAALLRDTTRVRGRRRSGHRQIWRFADAHRHQQGRPDRQCGGFQICVRVA